MAFLKSAIVNCRKGESAILFKFPCLSWFRVLCLLLCVTLCTFAVALNCYASIFYIALVYPADTLFLVGPLCGYCVLTQWWTHGPLSTVCPPRVREMTPDSITHLLIVASKSQFAISFLCKSLPSAGGRPSKMRYVLETVNLFAMSLTLANPSAFGNT